MKAIIPGMIIIAMTIMIIESGFVSYNIHVRDTTVNGKSDLSNTYSGKSTAQDTTKKGVQDSPHQTRDHGIGPVKNVTLGPLNEAMVKEGRNLFNSKCLLCHSLDQAKLGPPLRNITKERAPEFIMNMLLNTTVMEQEDPVVKDLKKTYNKISMTNPNLNQQQARAVLEYLRSVSK